MLRSYRVRKKLNRSGKVFGVKRLHLIKMLPGYVILSQIIVKMLKKCIFNRSKKDKYHHQ